MWCFSTVLQRCWQQAAVSSKKGSKDPLSTQYQTTDQKLAGKHGEAVRGSRARYLLQEWRRETKNQGYKERKLDSL